MILTGKNQEEDIIQEDLIQEAEEDLDLQILVTAEVKTEMDTIEAQVEKDGMKTDIQDPDQDQASEMV